jgi:dimethylglycine dehydrogenase
VLDEPGHSDAPANSSVFSGGERVGIVTSGGWSFTLDASIALAYVERSHATPGTHVDVEIFGERVGATVRTEPLYDPDNERPRAG